MQKSSRRKQHKYVNPHFHRRPNDLVYRRSAELPRHNYRFFLRPAFLDAPQLLSDKRQIIVMRKLPRRKSFSLNRAARARRWLKKLSSVESVLCQQSFAPLGRNHARE